MSKCKKCGRETALPKDKHCWACVHNAYEELEAQVAELRGQIAAVRNWDDVEKLKLIALLEGEL